MDYIISDIHGCFNDLMEMLNLINFSDNDKLYILGDIIDRGPEPIKCIEYIKNTKNIILLKGNHEDMMCDYYQYANKNPRSLDTLYALDLWFLNGGEVTFNQFKNLSKEKQIEYLDYLSNLPLFKVYDNSTLLVHAGIYPYKEDLNNNLKLQNDSDFLWIRRDFIQSEIKLPFKIFFGHTPISSVAKEITKHDNSTRLMRFNNVELFEKYEGGAYYFNNKIAIDGGCVFGDKLICIRLNDLKEFVIKK